MKYLGAKIWHIMLVKKIRNVLLEQVIRLTFFKVVHEVYLYILSNFKVFGLFNFGWGRVFLENINVICWAIDCLIHFQIMIGEIGILVGIKVGLFRINFAYFSVILFLQLDRLNILGLIFHKIFERIYWELRFSRKLELDFNHTF